MCGLMGESATGGAPVGGEVNSVGGWDRLAPTVRLAHGFGAMSTCDSHLTNTSDPASSALAQGRMQQAELY